MAREVGILHQSLPQYDILAEYEGACYKADSSSDVRTSYIGWIFIGMLVIFLEYLLSFYLPVKKDDVICRASSAVSLVVCCL